MEREMRGGWEVYENVGGSGIKKGWGGGEEVCKGKEKMS